MRLFKCKLSKNVLQIWFARNFIQFLLLFSFKIAHNGNKSQFYDTFPALNAHSHTHIKNYGEWKYFGLNNMEINDKCTRHAGSHKKISLVANEMQNQIKSAIAFKTAKLKIMRNVLVKIYSVWHSLTHYEAVSLCVKITSTS
jgi:hypothetical protein